ncbi:MAG: trypsin-like peptidase domain-containing protein [Oscillospiraceae bacterium]|nr:trypsin-like peptidase domain-containing protein [Candidatus Equicaccousia limihippi]
MENNQQPTNEFNENEPIAQKTDETPIITPQAETPAVTENENNQEFQERTFLERISDIVYDDTENATYTDALIEDIESNVPPVKKKSSSLKTMLIILGAVLVVIAVCCVLYFTNFDIKPTDKGTEIHENSGTKLDANEIYGNVSKSVVGIVVTDKSGKSYYASGVVYKKGYVVTNEHIFSGVAAADCNIVTYDGSQYKAEYVAGDERSDIAVLKTDAKLQPATLGNSDSCKAGESVYTIGVGTDAYENVMITAGIISSPSTRIVMSENSYADKLMQIDAAVLPYGSGGAVCNVYGQVIGITLVDLTASGYNDLSYAIPSQTVKKVADSLINSGSVGRAVLGISYTEIDKATANATGYVRGLRVGSVRQESDVYGKIKEGDTIIAVNGKTVTTADVLLDIIEKSKPGDVLKLTIISSDGKQNNINAKLISDQNLDNSQVSSGESPQNELPGLPDGSDSSGESTFDFPYGN